MLPNPAELHLGARRQASHGRRCRYRTNYRYFTRHSPYHGSDAGECGSPGKDLLRYIRNGPRHVSMRLAWTPG